MPSFLTKVFGRKKDEKEATSTPSAHKRLSHPSLLEGKYEAVSPPTSPSAVQFTDASPAQPTSVKESSLALFRSRSRTLDKQQPSTLTSASAPHLTLNLPVPKEEKSRALGVVFEADPESSSLLSDEVIGERRLSPLEALLLVKACSSAIVERGGLESLGLMHPHWYSASPEIQRKLISLFILSLGPKSPITTLSPTPASPSAIFETELSYTRDPHDIASVLRWGVRHLQLDGSSFGKDASPSEWSWYTRFATTERDSNYPPRAFSQSLVPLLPPAHLQLLTALLDIMSSFAAHGEAIGTSASKLSKLFGLWMVTAERAKASENWSQFYKRWEQAGRIFEHLFLAYIREEDIGHRMPLRLSELVKQYPYHGETVSTSSNDGLPLLPVPRFSTRQRDALFIRVDTLLPTPSSPRPAREHPLRLISEALKAPVASDANTTDAANTILDDLKAKALGQGEPESVHLALSKILDDESLRLLSLVPADQSSSTTSGGTSSSPSPSMLQAPESPARTRSASVGNPNGDSKTNGHNGTGSSLTNWVDFSTTGFGESSIGQSLSLSLADVEKSSPSQTSSRRPSPPRGRSTTLDTHTRKPAPPANSNAESKPKSSVKRVDLVQVDEAFFDFWSDALLDPISADWPAFVVCQLREPSSKVSLLVVEQTISRPVPPPLPPVPSADRREASPRPSVSASIPGRKSFTFSPTIKRFSFFNTQNRADPPAGGSKKTSIKSGTKSPRIGEMGEILEDESTIPPVPALDSAKPVQGLGLTTSVTRKPVPAVSSHSPNAEVALPAVPLVEAEALQAPTEVAPVATETIKTEAEAPEKPTIPVPANAEDVVVPVDTGAPTAEGEATEKALPPAPEPVVLTGSTPGPEVALNSSEPAAIAHAAEASQADEPAAGPEIAQSETTPEDLTPEDESRPAGVTSAFMEHLDSSEEVPKAAIAEPEPTREEEIAADAGAEYSEPIPEPAALDAAATTAEEAGVASVASGLAAATPETTVTHDTVPELEAKGENDAVQTNGNGSLHAADSTQADDTQDKPNHEVDASV